MRVKYLLNAQKKDKNKNRKNRQKHYYSGKKKLHTLKVQLLVNKETKEIICTHFSEGKKHDYQLFKDSGVRFKKGQEGLLDTGYQGIDKLYPDMKTPHKSSKLKPLTKAQKQENKELSAVRVLVENVIGSVKRFRIVAQRYRNRRKRFGMRFNLIAAIHNFEL